MYKSQELFLQRSQNLYILTDNMAGENQYIITSKAGLTRYSRAVIAIFLTSYTRYDISCYESVFLLTGIRICVVLVRILALFQA